MTTENYLDAALASTTFSRGQLEMLKAKIEESPKKTGLIELKTTATIDGEEIGAPYKAVAMIKDGRIHRDKGPAVAIDDLVSTPDGTGVRESKTILYMRNGVPDREDGPAVLAANGNVLWMQKGQLHRENGPAALIDGVATFALNGQIVTPHEFGKRTGLGEPGKDWMVEPNTGTIFTGLTTGRPGVATMRDAVPSVGQFLVVEDPDKPMKRAAPELPPLRAASDKQREFGESIRAATIEAAAGGMTPEQRENMIRSIGQNKDMSSAHFWISTRNMPLPERADAVRRVAENPREMTKAFGKHLGYEI